jgi:hypothetical protein
LIPSPSGGGLGWGWCIQHTPYLCFDTINVLQDIVVPESQDPVSFGLKMLRAMGVEGSGLSMLTSVNLYGEATFHADKVHHVIANGVLSAKPVTLELTHS